MKKLLLLSIALCFGFYAIAQNHSKLSSNQIYKPAKMNKVLISGDELPITFIESNPYVKSKTAKNLGTQIGNTWYDLQSNSNVGNRMIVYPDGTIAAVWTMATESSFTTRGTGYNQSTDDGSNWLAYPTTRLEDVKTGWPNIGKLTNGTEISVTHTANNGNLCWTTDGGANWGNKPIGDGTLKLGWPRMVTNGNTIHVIGNTNTALAFNGFTIGCLVYMKSTNGGDTWTNPIVPNGIDTSNYITHLGVNGTFSDTYGLAANGDNIAIVVGSEYVTPALIKSTNNGDSWSYTEILHLPIKKYYPDGGAIYDINHDGQQDYQYSSDGTNFVTIDNSGKCHVFFGNMLYTDDGSAGNWFPRVGGIYYWNEDMGTINYQYKWVDIDGVNTYEAIPDTVNFPIITDVVDINGNGTIDYPDNGSNQPLGIYYNSATSQPNAVIAPDGSITLFYSGIVEGTDGTVGSEHKAFRNIWEIHKFSSAPNNFTWSTPIRIAEDDFTEEVWPCVSPVVTGSLCNYNAHLWYQGDGYPGNSFQPNTGNPHPIVENAIYYVKTTAWCDGINEIKNVKSAPIVYPNPASNYVNIKYYLNEATNVSLSIYNICGQQIITTTKNLTSGESNVLLNIETLPQGVYFIKSDFGNKIFTKKLLVN